MSDPEEDTNPSANVPLWIEKAVARAMSGALQAIDAGCAAREARMLESEKRIIDALDKLGVARLELAQKATESGLHALRLDFDDLRSRLEHVEAFIRHPTTEPAPPPEGQ